MDAFTLIKEKTKNADYIITNQKTGEKNSIIICLMIHINMIAGIYEATYSLWSGSWFNMINAIISLCFNGKY